MNRGVVKKRKKKRTWKARLQWTLRESYKVNNLLSRETRLHLNIQLSLLSQSMKDVFISIPITSLRFISITWTRSLEPANCSAKQCQWHFKGSQRVFDGILMLSGFGGFQRRAWWAGSFEVRQQWQSTTCPTRRRRTLSFFSTLAQGWNNCAQQWLGSPKSLADDSRGETGWGFNFFLKFVIQVLFRPKPPVEPVSGKCSRNSVIKRHGYTLSLIVYSISFDEKTLLQNSHLRWQEKHITTPNWICTAIYTFFVKTHFAFYKITSNCQRAIPLKFNIKSLNDVI